MSRRRRTSRFSSTLEALAGAILAASEWLIQGGAMEEFGRDAIVYYLEEVGLKRQPGKGLTVWRRARMVVK